MTRFEKNKNNKLLKGCFRIEASIVLEKTSGCAITNYKKKRKERHIKGGFVYCHFVLEKICGECCSSIETKFINQLNNLFIKTLGESTVKCIYNKLGHI